MRAIAFALIFALGACGGGGTGPDDLDDGYDNFRAKIDGVEWNAELPPNGANPQPGMFVLTGTRFSGATNNYVISITLTHVTGPGTYRLGSNVMMRGGTAIVSQAPASGWGTTLNAQAGEVVITAVSATRIEGTFHFVADPQAPTTGTRAVTEGSFDLLLAGAAGVQTAANKGGIATAMVGGALFHGATAVMSYVSNTVTIVMNDGVRTLSFSLANVTASGPYAFSTSAPIRQMGVGGEPGNLGAVWSSTPAGGSGSVDLTITADRISGTFTGVVIGIGGGVTGPMNVSGSFDFGRAMP
jgi:hypothetical protein